MIRTDHGDAGKLALRTRHRRQRYRLHARYNLQHLLQLIHCLQETLAVLHRPERMARQKLRQHREAITNPRVVFHRARTQRIEMRVDGKIQLRQPRKMAHDFKLRSPRQNRFVLAQPFGRNVAAPPPGWRKTFPAGRFVFKYQVARSCCCLHNLRRLLRHSWLYPPDREFSVAQTSNALPSSG